MRISSATLLLLAACSSSVDKPLPGSNLVIWCALNGAREFGPECVVEERRTPEGRQLVVRHPDGGFRRFDVLTDGKGLATADGALPAQVAVQGGAIEVVVGDDRYRFPATVTDAPH